MEALKEGKLKTKTEFLEVVRRQWYLRELTAEIVSLALADEEKVQSDYLYKKERVEGYPVEERYILTDKRLLRFRITHEGWECQSLCTSKDILDITQHFCLKGEGIHAQVQGPSLKLLLKSGKTIEFTPPEDLFDQEKFKSFVKELISWFYKGA